MVRELVDARCLLPILRPSMDAGTMASQGEIEHPCITAAVEVQNSPSCVL